MLIAALVAGSGMASGVPGAFLILVIAGLFGGAYSGIGIFIAMRTGNAQAAQAGFLLFFPLLFMAPAFAPLAVFDDWLRIIATINPVTYIMEGMRGLVMEGYAWPVTEGGQIVFGDDGLPKTKDPPALHWAFVSLAGFSAVTMTLAVLAPPSPHPRRLSNPARRLSLPSELTDQNLEGSRCLGFIQGTDGSSRPRRPPRSPH